MNYKSYLVISFIVFGISVSAFFIGNHIYEQEREIEFYKDKMVLVEGLMNDLTDLTKFINSCQEKDGIFNPVTGLCTLKNNYAVYFVDWDIESDKELFDWLGNPN